MANISSLTFSKITGEEEDRWGRRRVRIVRLTAVASTSTYLNGGISDATNFPATWALRLGFNSIQRVVPIHFLRESTFEIAYPWEVDLTNLKVILYGGATTAAEDVPLSEIPDTTAFTDGTYTADCLVIGK